MDAPAPAHLSSPPLFVIPALSSSSPPPLCHPREGGDLPHPWPDASEIATNRIKPPYGRRQASCISDQSSSTSRPIASAQRRTSAKFAGVSFTVLIVRMSRNGSGLPGEFCLTTYLTYNRPSLRSMQIFIVRSVYCSVPGHVKFFSRLKTKS